MFNKILPKKTEISNKYVKMIKKRTEYAYIFFLLIN